MKTVPELRQKIYMTPQKIKCEKVKSQLTSSTPCEAAPEVKMTSDVSITFTNGGDKNHYLYLVNKRLSMHELYHLLKKRMIFHNTEDIEDDVCQHPET